MVQTSASTPRKRPKQKRSKDTVNVIIEATTRILEEEGFEKVSTNRVAKRAGVSIGSLYQYFPNKESLVLAVFEQHCEQMLALLRHSVDHLAEEPIEKAVRIYIHAMIESHMVNPRLHQVLTHQVHLGSGVVHQLHDVARDLVRDYLELHKERILPKNLDIAAFVLVMSIEGIVHAAMVEYKDEIDFRLLEEEIRAFVLGYLLGGIGREE